MDLQILIQTYGRYLSSSNVEVLKKQWNQLSEFAKEIVVRQLKYTKNKEIQLLYRSFQKSPEVYNVIQSHISEDRLKSLHTIEQQS